MELLFLRTGLILYHTWEMLIGLKNFQGFFFKTFLLGFYLETSLWETEVCLQKTAIICQDLDSGPLGVVTVSSVLDGIRRL